MSPRPASGTRAAWIDLAGRFLALVLVFAFFALLVEDGKFCTLRNLENIMRQSAVYAMAGLGMTLVIILAGIDLSLGSMIALSVIAASAVLNLGGGGAGAATAGASEGDNLVYARPVLVPLAAAAAGILAGAAAGLLNGGLVVGLRLVPFIVTLGTMGAIRGVAKGIARERDLYPPEGAWIGRLMDPVADGEGWLLPAGIWMLLAGAAAMAFVLRHTRFGRHVFAIGSNEETARLCGVPVGRTKLLVYTLCGLFCGIAGLLQFSYIGGVGQPTTAVSYELFIIAAVIIGGASFNGGEGSILGTLLGALTITVLYTGGQQMGWPKWVQEMVIGAIIILAVALDRLRHRRPS